MVLDQRRIDERRDGCLVSVANNNLQIFDGGHQLYKFGVWSVLSTAICRFLDGGQVLSSGVFDARDGLDAKQTEQHEPSQRILCQTGCCHVAEYGENQK